MKLIDRIKSECVCRYNPNKRYNHFAFILRRNKILSVGVNRPFKTHPTTTHYRFGSIHAEIDALLSLDYYSRKKVHKCTLVSVRMRPTYTLGRARPCHLCMEYIQRAGIREIAYSDSKGRIIVEEIR